MNLAVVARTGWRLACREVWFAGRARRGLLLLTFTLLLALTLGAGALALFTSIARSHAPLEWSQHVLGWAFTLTSMTLALGDLQTALHALVVEPNLERLRAAPLAPRQLLGLKLFETLPRTLTPVLGIALPVALAYAWAHGGVRPLALGTALLALWAVPLGLGLVLALPLLRLAPATRMRESLAVFATLAFMAGWLMNTFWMPRLVHDGSRLSAGLRALPPPPEWAPATWAAHAITAHGSDAIAASVACVLAAAAALAGSMAVATRLLTGVHARASAASGRIVRSSSRRAPTLMLAFLRRDAALTARDWPVLLDVLANLALWSLLPLAVIPVAPLPPLELARDVLIALSVSLGYDVAARALPLELASIAWARLSPVGGARWVYQRLAGVALVNGTLLLAAAALVCGWFGLRGGAAFDVLAFGLAAATSASATGLLLGAMLGDPEWTNPQAMLGPGGRAISVGVLVSQAGAWVAVSHRLSVTAPVRVGNMLLMLGFSALAAALLSQAAARVVERKELSGR